MAKIKTKEVYEATMERIEELLPLVTDETPVTNKYSVELDLLSEMVSEYEEQYFPIQSPSLIEVMKLRMYEMGLNQAGLAKLLGISTSRVSDIFNGRCEPTLQVARKICKEMNIDASIVLGV